MPKKVQLRDEDGLVYINNDMPILQYPTIPISVTTTTSKTTIFEKTIVRGGLYLLTASIPLNNYGVQTGREHIIRVLINDVVITSIVRVINVDVYTMSEMICVPFLISPNGNVKITVQSGVAKQWACAIGDVYLTKLN